MGDFNLKVSDIFRYILLGCIECILCVVIFYDNIKSIDIENVKNTLEAFPFDKSIIVLIASISVFYLFGYITQLVIGLFFHGNFLGTGIGETACFIKHYPKWIFNKEKFPYPDWIYYSEAPDKVVEIFQDITETGSDSENKLEFYYANQFFQGMALAFVSFSVFALNVAPFIKTTILLGIFVALFVLGSNATRNRQLILANKILMYVIPALAFLALLFCRDGAGNSYPLAALISLLMLASLFLAGFLSRKQLRRIDILSHQKDEKLFDTTLVKYGIPRVFILTRVDETAFPFLREQLESIAMQDYPDIKVIVIIDKDNMSSVSKSSAEGLFDEFVRKGLRIQYSYSVGSGAAALAYETRQVFINYATDNDISVCLDADDKLAHPQSISNIVAKMFRTQSNICIIGFETFGNTYMNFAKNFHNYLVKMMAKTMEIKGSVDESKSNDCMIERAEYLTPQNLIDNKVAHLVSTLGWVKCYRKCIAKAYQAFLSPYKEDFGEFTKYEDFPDIIALLSADSRICAVAQASISFRKRMGSVTTKVSSENYDRLIPYYLKLADTLAKDVLEQAEKQEKTPRNRDKAKFAASASELVHSLFIPYKFVQYLNVVYAKTVIKPEITDYSCDLFYRKFRDDIYSGDEHVFRKGIIRILNDNKTNKIFDDVPKKLADHIKKHLLTDDEFHVVAEAYGISLA